MTNLPTLKLPVPQLFSWYMSPQHHFHFIRRPRPQARDVAIVHPDKGDNRHKVSEEQMSRRMPEVVGRYEHGERPEETDENEGGEVPGLEFEDTDNGMSE